MNIMKHIKNKIEKTMKKRMENKEKLMNIIKHIKKYSNCNVLNEKICGL